MEINVDIHKNIDVDFNVEELCNSVIEKTLKIEGCPYSVNIDIIFTDNADIRLYNNRFRGIDSETDVLSFPNIPFKIPSDFSIIDECFIDCFDLDNNIILLGDIIISGEKAIEQSKEYGHSIKREIGFLIVHSVLHLLGYDHIDELERELMENKQKDILQQLDIVR